MTAAARRRLPTLRWPRAWLASLRVRVVVRHVVLLALATTGSILVARQLIAAQIDERVEHALTQEVEELERLRRQDVPAAGRPRRRVEALFDLYLERNVPSRGEAFLTFVGGQPYRRSAQVLPYRIDQDPELVRRWAAIASGRRGRVSTPGGDIDFLAVPVRAAGRTEGVFVVASFRRFETSDLGTITVALAGVGAAVLLFGALLTWRGAGRVIAPMRDVARSARAITETDLSGRVPAQGHDEVAELARTLNEMLARLESAFTAQRRFLDDAGHELRTPITIVRGHLELMGDDPAERRETLALVLDELDRMSRLVEEVLTLAKAERPDFLAYETVDLEALAREVHAKAAALAPRDWRLGATARGTIVADRQRLTQALVQLAANAAQHTGEGDPIEFSLALEGTRARLGVRDWGPGVPEADRERIFERFGRGPGARREGAGLGLAIVRAIAEAHGGRARLEDAGPGASFVIEVPIDPPREGPAREAR